jgi:hypothetical protein
MHAHSHANIQKAAAGRRMLLVLDVNKLLLQRIRTNEMPEPPRTTLEYHLVQGRFHVFVRPHAHAFLACVRACACMWVGNA